MTNHTGLSALRTIATATKAQWTVQRECQLLTAMLMVCKGHAAEVDGQHEPDVDFRSVAQVMQGHRMEAYVYTLMDSRLTTYREITTMAETDQSHECKQKHHLTTW